MIYSYPFPELKTHFTQKRTQKSKTAGFREKLFIWLLNVQNLILISYDLSYVSHMTLISQNSYDFLWFSSYDLSSYSYDLLKCFWCMRNHLEPGTTLYMLRRLIHFFFRTWKFLITCNDGRWLFIHCEMEELRILAMDCSSKKQTNTSVSKKGYSMRGFLVP